MHMLSIYSRDTIAQPTLYKTNKCILSICSAYTTYIHTLYYNNLVCIFNVLINKKCILLLFILCLMSDLDLCWAHIDYSLYIYGEKTQIKKKCILNIYALSIT